MSFWRGFSVGVFLMFMGVDIWIEFLHGSVTGNWKLLERSLMFDSLILVALILIWE